MVALNPGLGGVKNAEIATTYAFMETYGTCNYAKKISESSLLQRFYGYGVVYVLTGSSDQHAEIPNTLTLT